MIGTHNSMTYLKAKNKVWEVIAGYWRCQDKNLGEQIEAGVRWFDIRIAYDEGTKSWVFAHGEVDLAMSGKTDSKTGRGAGGYRLTLDSVLGAIQQCGGVARIMLERGDDVDEAIFAQEFNPASIVKRWPCVIGAVIKKNWRVLWESQPVLAITDLSYVPYKRDTAWYKQLKGILGFPFKSIKKRAEKIRKPTRAQKNNANRVYVYDYV